MLNQYRLRILFLLLNLLFPHGQPLLKRVLLTFLIVFHYTNCFLDFNLLFFYHSLVFMVLWVIHYFSLDLLEGSSIQSIPFSLFVFTLTNFHELCLRHLFLLLVLFILLSLEFLSLFFVTSVLIVQLHDLRLEQSILYTLSEIHIFLVVHTWIVLNGHTV